MENHATSRTFFGRSLNPEFILWRSHAQFYEVQGDSQQRGSNVHVTPCKIQAESSEAIVPFSFTAAAAAAEQRNLLGRVKAAAAIASRLCQVLHSQAGCMNSPGCSLPRPPAVGARDERGKETLS